MFETLLLDEGVKVSELLFRMPQRLELQERHTDHPPALRNQVHMLPTYELPVLCTPPRWVECPAAVPLHNDAAQGVGKLQQVWPPEERVQQEARPPGQAHQLPKGVRQLRQF